VHRVQRGLQPDLPAAREYRLPSLSKRSYGVSDKATENTHRPESTLRLTGQISVGEDRHHRLTRTRSRRGTTLVIAALLGSPSTGMMVALASSTRVTMKPG
jgi:hypothetical protein